MGYFGLKSVDIARWAHKQEQIQADYTVGIKVDLSINYY